MTGDVRITDVEVVILDGGVEYGTRLPDGEMSGPRHTCLIRVSTDAGIVGYADVDSHPWVVKAVVDAMPHIPGFCAGLRDAVVGQNAFDRDALWQRMYQHSWYHGRRGVALHAMSGIDIALWDIAGKAVGQSVSDLLGGRRNSRVRAYASTLFRETPEQMRTAARGYIQRGFTAIKFGWAQWGADVARDHALLAAAREEVGDSVDLMVDGYISGDAATVRQHVAAMADLRPLWCEEPLPADQPDALASLGRASQVPIATGEQLGGVSEFRELLREPGVSVVQPDLSRCGGITAARDIARLAAERGCQVIPHAWTSHLLTAAALQLNAWLPGEVMAEYNASSAPVTAGLATGLSLVDGYLEVPTGPGLGVEVDGAVIDRYRVA